MKLLQEQRTLNLFTVLEDDELVLTAFTGEEHISGLFEFRLEMLSENNAIRARDITGTSVSFTVAGEEEEEPRLFHGFVRRFEAGRVDRDGRRAYRAYVVPWLWCLTRTTDCRVFQNKDVVEIMQEILDEAGMGDYEIGGVRETYRMREFCFQYNETDFDFISRLLEEEGLYYYFRHEEDRHVLVLSDQVTGYHDCQQREVDFPDTEGTQTKRDHIMQWDHAYEFGSGKWAGTDYNHTAPNTSLVSGTDTLVDLPGNKSFERFEFPGLYGDTDAGKRMSRIRMEEEEASHDVVGATSNCRSFAPGGKFKLKNHRAEHEADEYVITSIRHEAREPNAYRTSGSVGSAGLTPPTVPSIDLPDSVDDVADAIGIDLNPNLSLDPIQFGPIGIGVDIDNGKIDIDFTYRNKFLTIKANITFRPKRKTPKPVVLGSQTAVVVGNEGEEITTNEYGAVKIQFHWDRRSNFDVDSSPWVRVAQPIAGKGWGAMTIPRIGQEVVVTFLNNDPDCPLITGSVYNADQMPAYELPAHKTKSYFKSCSSLEGEGFNELRYEDKKGKEQIFMHAERDLDIRVKNCVRERAVGARDLIVGWFDRETGEKGGDQKEKVWNDKHQIVKRNQIEHIEGDAQLMVGNGEVEEGGNLDIVIAKDKREFIEGNSNLHINNNQRTRVDLSKSLHINCNSFERVEGCRSATAGEMEFGSDSTMLLDAKDIVLRTPGGYIRLSEKGITISGTMVWVNSSAGESDFTGKFIEPYEVEEPNPAAPVEPDYADDGICGIPSNTIPKPTLPPLP